MTLLTAPMGFEQHAQSIKALLKDCCIAPVKDCCIAPVLIECCNVCSKRAMLGAQEHNECIDVVISPPNCRKEHRFFALHMRQHYCRPRLTRTLRLHGCCGWNATIARRTAANDLAMNNI